MSIGLVVNLLLRRVLRPGALPAVDELWEVQLLYPKKPSGLTFGKPKAGPDGTINPAGRLTGDMIILAMFVHGLEARATFHNVSFRARQMSTSAAHNIS